MLSLIYPKICLHCRAAPGKRHFCSPCSELFDFLPKAGRCSQCFIEIPQTEGSCKLCRTRASPLRRVAACFDDFGPAGSLLKAFKEQKQTRLARDIAAFMVIQLQQQDWLPPEQILPIPLPNWKKMWRGFNQSLLIAQEIGKLLKLPVIDPLKRKVDGFSSQLLERKERLNLKPSAFIWKRQAPDLENRVLLLVDDLIVTGATLRAAAVRLQDKLPRAIYGLTFCGSS